MIHINLNDPGSIRRAAQADLLPAAFVAKLLRQCERMRMRYYLADGTEVDHNWQPITKAGETP